jgi:hypothetical protein
MHALRLCYGDLRGSADVEQNEAIDSAASMHVQYAASSAT